MEQQNHTKTCFWLHKENIHYQGGKAVGWKGSLSLQLLDDCVQTSSTKGKEVLRSIVFTAVNE